MDSEKRSGSAVTTFFRLSDRAKWSNIPGLIQPS